MLGKLVTSLFLVLYVVVVWLVIRVLTQDHKVFQNRSLRDKLFRGKLCAFAVLDEHWRVVSLEACDFLRLARLTDGVDRLTDTHLGVNWLEVFVELHELNFLRGHLP